MKTELTKSVEYAYPSSTTANKAGFGKIGCWFVALYKGNTVYGKKHLKYFAGNDAKYNATAFANTLPYPINTICSNVQ